MWLASWLVLIIGTILCFTQWWPIGSSLLFVVGAGQLIHRKFTDGKASI